MTAQKFFDPEEPRTGMTDALPGFIGLPRKPGESLADYQLRLQEAQLPYQQAKAERKQIDQLAKDQETGSRNILNEQKTIQQQRLSDLATLLAEQQGTAFNREIPKIANTAQGQGFLETSGFGNSLADKYKELTEDTSFQIARQGLSDRDLEISGIGDIGANNRNLGVSGLERQFSVTDNARSEALARELGKLGVPAPMKQPSTTDKLLTNAGPILSGVGAVKGA